MKRNAIWLVVVITLCGGACSGDATETTETTGLTETTTAAPTTSATAPPPTSAAPSTSIANTTVTSVALPVGWRDYSSERGYAIWLPPAWEFTTSDEFSEEFQSPNEAILTVYRVAPVDEGIPADQRTVEGLQEAVVAYFESDFAATVDTFEPLTLADQRGYLVVMHYGEGADATHVIDAGVLDGDWWWELLWKAPAGTEEDDLGLFRQMMEGFSIDPAPQP